MAFANCGRAVAHVRGSYVPILLKKSLMISGSMIPLLSCDSLWRRAMMGRLDHDQEQLFYSFCLDEAVPHDHPVREIAAVLDLSWVRSELAPFYSKIGRPSIDPELMMRMLIIGYASQFARNERYAGMSR